MVSRVVQFHFTLNIHKSPVGMEEIDPGSSSEDCYQLLKGIDGLCQEARQFWKKFVNTVKQEPFGFSSSISTYVINLFLVILFT